MRALGTLWLLVGCGTQYTNPVYVSEMGLELSAHTTPPVIMLVWDKSGSTSQQIDAGCSGSACATRISEMKAWAIDSLPSIGASARVGLQVFPSGSECGSSDAADILAAPPAAPDSSAAVLAQIPGIMPMGGTPTSQSMALTPSAMPKDDAEHFAVLLTDGVPNCNPDNPNTCVDPVACQCTNGTCPATLAPGDSNFCIRDCLDEAGTEATLRNIPIQTIVVAFGSDFATDAAKTIATNIGAAGGSHEACAANSAADLSPVTDAIGLKILRSVTCRFVVDPPSTGPRARVFFGGAEVPEADVLRESPTVVRVLGDSCQQLLGSSTLQPSLFDAVDP